MRYQRVDLRPRPKSHGLHRGPRPPHICLGLRLAAEGGRSKGYVGVQLPPLTCCPAPLAACSTCVAAPGWRGASWRRRSRSCPSGWCPCHLGRCQASCNGNPGSILDGNTCPLFAAQRAPAPSPCPVSLGPALFQAVEQSFIRAETPGGREWVGERFGGQNRAVRTFAAAQSAGSMTPAAHRRGLGSSKHWLGTYCVLKRVKEPKGIMSDTIPPCPRRTYGELGEINT